MAISPALFALRRKVIENLYEARRLTNDRVPYIKVRIVETEPNVAGQAFLAKNEIHISNRMENWSDLKIKHIVFHELAHQYLGAEHSKKKDLMNPTYQPQLTSEKIEKDFRSLASKKLGNVI